MKLNATLEQYVKIADIHAERLNVALNEVKKLMPLTSTKFELLENEQVAFMDMMITRFSKLQDIIGVKIFPLILDILGEDAPSFIDKLNRLEKLTYLEDANWWMQLRDIRNQITPDYPDNYQILAEHFNQLVSAANELLIFWSGFKRKIHPLS